MSNTTNQTTTYIVLDEVLFYEDRLLVAGLAREAAEALTRGKAAHRSYNLYLGSCTTPIAANVSRTEAERIARRHAHLGTTFILAA